MTTAPLSADQLLARTKRYMPWLVAVALFMENLDATIVNTAVPTMAKSLEVQPLSLKAVMTSYALSLAVFIPISGWMADKFGTKRVFFFAVTLFMIGSLFCGISTDIPMLVASRIIQGMGGAMMTPVGRLALVRTFPRSEMLQAMNFVVIPALIGPLIGPSLGGFIVHFFHWRVIFFINLPIAILGLFLIKNHMPDYREESTGKLDTLGFILFGSGIGLFSYVLEVFGEHTLPISAIILMIVISGILLMAYGFHAQRVPVPVLNLKLFKIRTFRAAVAGGFVTRLGIGGMPFLLPLLYQIGLGYKPWAAGLLTVPQATAAIGMKVFSRPLLRKFGFRSILVLNTVFLGFTIMSFSFINPGASVILILCISFAQGFFASLQFTSMNSLIYADIDDKDASKASSLGSTAQQMSLSFGIAFSSLVAGWFLGHVDQTVAAQTVPALHKAFLVMGILTVVSSLTFWSLRPHDGDNVSNRVKEAEKMAGSKQDPNPPEAD